MFFESKIDFKIFIVLVIFIILYFIFHKKINEKFEGLMKREMGAYTSVRQINEDERNCLRANYAKKLSSEEFKDYYGLYIEDSKRRYDLQHVPNVEKNNYVLLLASFRDQGKLQKLKTTLRITVLPRYSDLICTDMVQNNSDPMLIMILSYIKSASWIIVDITERNPNVMYELGFAHAWGKRVTLICEGLSKQVLPKLATEVTDLQGNTFVFYDKEDLTNNPNETKNDLVRQLLTIDTNDQNLIKESNQGEVS